jgi:hypothetical protein
MGRIEPHPTSCRKSPWGERDLHIYNQRIEGRVATADLLCFTASWHCRGGSTLVVNGIAEEPAELCRQSNGRRIYADDGELEARVELLLGDELTYSLSP